MVDKKCLACDTYRDECTGRDKACGDFTSIDWTRAVPDSPEPKEVPLIPSPLKPAGESRQAKFVRIGDKRLEQALEAIRKLEHLANSYHRASEDVHVYTYEWTTGQALDIIKPIETALARLKQNLLQPAKDRENGLQGDK